MNDIHPPAGAEAALYWVGEQLLYQDRSDGERLKCVSAAAVRQAFGGSGVDSGWLPPGVIRWGTSARGVWMVRWHEPRVYRLSLAGRRRPLQVPLPSLIWFGQGRNYYVFAAKETRMSAKARLYRAPLPNVNQHGLICFGKNAHLDVAKGGFETAWQTFWAAPFNEDHSDHKSRRAEYRESVNLLLTRLARERATKYPLGDLVAMDDRLTLDGAIERLTQRGGNE